MIRDIGLVVVAYLLGFLSAIPIGATQVEVAKRVLARRMGAALLTAAGTTTSDMMYGALALFGIAPFLEKPAVLAVFGWAGAGVLAVLAALTWRQADKVQAPNAKAQWTGDGASYLTGFVLGITYPPIMLSWLLAVALVKGMGLTGSFTPPLRAAFIVAGGSGLFSYQVVLASVLRRTRHFFSDRTMRRVYRGLSMVLAILSVGFLVAGILKMFK